MRERFGVNRAPRRKARRDVSEVSSGRSSGEGRDAIKAKDQRSRTRQHLVALGFHAACVKREVSAGV